MNTDISKITIADSRISYETDYDLLIKQMISLSEIEGNYVALFANISALLNESLKNINWVGFYILREPEKLTLGPFQGKTACIHIDFGKGVCGKCVEKNRIIRVDDVHKFEGHIACDSASLSELVIPVHDENKKIRAVLDIDSPVLARFSEEDEKGLGLFCEVLEKYIKWD